MLADNIKYLRRKRKLSQQQLANALQLARTTLGDYERGNTEPNIQTIIEIARYFEISIDELLSTDISLKDYEITRNQQMRVLAISVDAQQRNNIELVDVKAEAGYLEAFHNPQYIKDLPKINFPNMADGTYRGFEINGDSMLPIESGSIVICQYIERLEDIKNNKTYVVIGKENGIVYKRIINIPQENKLLLLSDNTVYTPYDIYYEDISEIWEYYAHVSFNDAKINLDNILQDRIQDIHWRVKEIHQLMIDD